MRTVKCRSTAPPVANRTVHAMTAAHEANFGDEHNLANAFVNQ